LTRRGLSDSIASCKHKARLASASLTCTHHQPTRLSYAGCEGLECQKRLDERLRSQHGMDFRDRLFSVKVLGRGFSTPNPLDVGLIPQKKLNTKRRSPLRLEHRFGSQAWSRASVPVTGMVLIAARRREPSLETALSHTSAVKQSPVPGMLAVLLPGGLAWGREGEYCGRGEFYGGPYGWRWGIDPTPIRRPQPSLLGTTTSWGWAGAAEVMMGYLVLRHQVDPKRLSPWSYGQSRPIADNRAADGRALNRRVEFKVLVR